MDTISSSSGVDAAIAGNAVVAIGVSGGKDSQAAAIAVYRALDRAGHTGPRLLIHSDLGVVEWNDSLPACQRLADHLRTELVVVRRKAGDLMERWEARWQSSIRRYIDLSTVTLVPCWSTPSLRFCTSELKTHVIRAELKRRFKGATVINVTGVRRDESAARSKGTVADQDKDGFWNWRPLSDWTEAEVFSCIDSSGMAPHPAYREFGMSRVSCRFCIMSNINDLVAAAAQEESHKLYRRMVALEIESTFAFQGSRWLGDVAPQLLNDDRRAGLIVAKLNAAARIEAEAAITKEMKFVKGWPLRMLTDSEASILAVTRFRVGNLINQQANMKFMNIRSIHARYAELMSENAARAERSATTKEAIH